MRSKTIEQRPAAQADIASSAEPGSRPAPAYVIDDEREVRRSTVFLLKAFGISARAFSSGEDFLDELKILEPGCLLIDIRMPGLSGLELLDQLRKRACFWPAIVVTGHGEISLAVRSVKLGATEFLEKPYSPDELRLAVAEASALLGESVLLSKRVSAARKVWAELSERERQVFDGVVEGQTSKEIAAALNLSPRTVESYRVNMMIKLGANGPHDLHAIASHCRYYPAGPK